MEKTASPLPDFQVETKTTSSIKQDPAADGNDVDEKSTKRLLRKVDFVLIPFLALLYL